VLTILTGLNATAAVPVPKLKPGTEIATMPIRAPGARYFGSQTPYPVLKPRGTTKPVRKPVIVIDPGHGGTDPGTIGVKGTHEKTITTKAANELAARLRKSGRYTVILTRTNDSYVDHDDRLRIARTGQADLFISIHADSAGASAKGATVYTLADRAKGRQRRIVNNQNWILDVDLSAQTDPVGDILVDLAQRKTESQSDAFAEILLAELSGNKVELIGNSHRRAGYYVLLAPDVPAVLLELGFLSNPIDEKRLKTKRYRDKITSSVEQAIDAYMAQR
jgi:N-acetylmuramoyl-L-alanine amidase